MEKSRICASFGQHFTVEGVTAAFANHTGDVHVVNRCDRQSKLGQTVATKDVGTVVIERVGTRLCEGRVKTVSVITFTCANRVVQDHVVRRIDRDVQVHGAVAVERGAVHLGEGGVANPISGESKSILIVRSSVTKRCF